MSIHTHDNDTDVHVPGRDVVLRILVCDNSFTHPMASGRASGLSDSSDLRNWTSGGPERFW